MGHPKQQLHQPEAHTFKYKYTDVLGVQNTRAPVTQSNARLVDLGCVSHCVRTAVAIVPVRHDTLSQMQ